MVQRFGDRLDEQFDGTGFEKEVRYLFNKEQFYDPTVDNPMDAGQFPCFEKQITFGLICIAHRMAHGLAKGLNGEKEVIVV
ncbi:MAG: hypothetical protein QXT63_01245 [Thermoplasmata archaeon]